jgi:glucosamine 6-phosphate synthetase-like amidotransferase/phosphosugar isomerase protein
MMSDEQAMMPIAATRQEVATQPQSVMRVLEERREEVQALAKTLAERDTAQVLASGSGDSWFAAQAVRQAWEQMAGLPCEAHQAYEYAAYGRLDEGARTAHFVISSSGRPTTTWDALDRALATEAYVVGVTDNDAPDNPFVSRPHAALVPGAVKVGWPTQTTTATMAILIDLAIATGEARGHLSRDEGAHLARTLRTTVRQMGAVQAASAGWTERLARTLGGQRLLTLVGGGPSYAVCQMGSALLAEGPQEVGLAIPVEEFHHALRVATLHEGETVILVAPAGQSAERCRDTVRVVRQWGARLIALLTSEHEDWLDEGGDGLLLPVVPEPFSPLLTVLPLQLLSIALASNKVEGGYQRPRSVPQ